MKVAVEGVQGARGAPVAICIHCCKRQDEF